jgi:serine/threonine protein kinase
MVNLTFKEYKVNDTLDWILNRSAEQFMAPEIFQGVAPNVQADLYSIGAVMFFMTFYEPQKYEVMYHHSQSVET